MDWVNILISLFSSVITATIAGIFSVSSMKKQLKQTQLMVEDQKKERNSSQATRIGNSKLFAYQ